MDIVVKKQPCLDITLHSNQNGKTPVFVDGVTTTLPAGSIATLNVIANGSSPTGDPIYKVNAGIPKGDKGDKGDSIEIAQTIGKSETSVMSQKAVTKYVVSAKELLFRDLWNSACGNYGTYNSTTEYYELNGLTDITYQQAISIYIDTLGIANQNMNCLYTSKSTRTNIPLGLGNYAMIYAKFNLDYAFVGTNFEIINLYPIRIKGNIREDSIKVSNCTSIFNISNKLTTILGIINFENITSSIDINSGNELLTTFQYCSVKSNIRLNSCKVASYNSLNYLVTNAANTSAITVTVHADVFKLLSGTATDAQYTASGQTKATWQALTTTASNKLISFATA